MNDTITKSEARAVRKKVEAGAAWLDKQMPAWFKRISLEDLSMARCDLCICGQLAKHSRKKAIRETAIGEPDYIDFIPAYGLNFGYGSDNSANTYGFAFQTNEEYEVAEAHWTRIIRRKLREAQVAA